MEVKEVKKILKSGVIKKDGINPALYLTQQKIADERYKVLVDDAGNPVLNLLTAKKIIKSWDQEGEVEVLIIKKQILEGSSVNATNYRILYRAVQ